MKNKTNISIKEYIKDNVLCLDGGMGTTLHSMGLGAGELPERWNLSHPDRIREVHKSYYDAGANVVCTNTFGANLLKYDENELEEIVRAAIEIAKSAKNESTGEQPKWIALDIGPSGKMLSPLGDLDFEEAVRIFSTGISSPSIYISMISSSNMETASSSFSRYSMARSIMSSGISSTRMS